MVKKQIIAQPKRAYRNNKTDYKITVNHKLKESSIDDYFSLYVEMRAKGKVTQMASAFTLLHTTGTFTKLSKLKSYNLILEAEKKSLESIISKRFDIDGDKFKMGDVIKDYRKLNRGKEDLLVLLEKKMTTHLLKMIVKKSKFDKDGSPLTMYVDSLVSGGITPESRFKTFEEYKNYNGELKDSEFYEVPITNEDSILDDCFYNIVPKGFDFSTYPRKYDISFLINIMAEFGVTELESLRDIHFNMLSLREFLYYSKKGFSVISYEFFEFFCLDDLKNGLVSQVVLATDSNDIKMSKTELMERISQIEFFLFDDIL